MEEPLTTNHLLNKGTNSNCTVAKFGIAADLKIRVSWVRIPPENGALTKYKGTNSNYIE